MVCDVGGGSAVRNVFKTRHSVLRAVLEDRGIHIRDALYGWAPAGRVRVARGLGRHRHRSNRTTGSLEAREFQPAKRLYLLANPGNFRPGDGAHTRDDGSVG